jgi:hypothetical protein
MSDDKAYTLPAPDAPAEEWGRLAVTIPGWRWMPGMQPWFGSASDPDGGPSIERVFCPETWQGTRAWPDPDDPATAGCLLRLLGAHAIDVVCPAANNGRWAVSVSSPHHIGIGSTLGRACIAAAAALGRWPGGEG